MPPNLLIITTDQQRWDTLGCYGNRLIQTPNLDRLAQAGIRLERAYCESPICIPSRITMVTGKKASHHGATLHNSNMRDQERTLAHVLAENGYLTHFIGKAHFRSQEQRGTEESLPDWREGVYDGWNGPYAGFQTVALILGHSNPLLGHYGQWISEKYPYHLANFMVENMRPINVSCGQGVFQNDILQELHSSSYVADQTVNFLEMAAQYDQPFFCFSSFPDPHWPISPPSPFFELYDELDDAYFTDQTQFPSNLDHYPRQFHRLVKNKPTGYDGGGHLVRDRDDIARITRPYWGAISFIDTNIGRILDKLDELKLSNNTIVLFTADHGEHMGAHGLMAKGGFMYEEFIRCPFIIRYPGKILSGQTTSALFSFVDIVPTILDLTGIEGFDLAMDGISQSAVLCGEANHIRSQLTITHFSQHISREIPDIHSIENDEWKLNYYAGDQNGELYHLASDPDEKFNLYHHPGFLDRRKQMVQLLLDELILVNDHSPHLQRSRVEPGYADHTMKYEFWKEEFDQLKRTSN